MYKVLENLSLRGMASFGNWEYDGNSTADLFDESQNFQGTSTLYLDGVKVGDAAQTTAALGADYNFYKGFTFGVNWRYAGNLYANINAPDFTVEGGESLELPSYNLFDARLAYNWLFDKGNALEFAVNVDNIFDELYISESDTNIFTNDTSKEWEGIDTRNRVFFGFGTTWNASVRYRF
jgi:outer membrane receptor for monomeric catechols